MRTAALALSAAIALVCAASAFAVPQPIPDAPTAVTNHGAVTHNQPQPLPDVRRHGPAPVGRCVNDPALLHRCTEVYNRCTSVWHRRQICTNNFNRCCAAPATAVH